MAVTAGLTGSTQTVGATEERFFTPSADQYHCTSLKVRVQSGAVATVRIPELHGASGGARIPIGETEIFRFGHDGISEAYVSGNGAVIDWYPVAAETQL